MSKKEKFLLGRPEKQGLYNPKNEHDACGIGFVANIKGIESHTIVDNGLEMLENLEHRGAVGADKTVGDGAGILTKIPNDFFKKILEKKKVSLPPSKSYGVAMIFFPREKNLTKKCLEIINQTFKIYDLEIFYKRNVPVDNKILSKVMRKSEPDIKQLFIRDKNKKISSDKFNLKLFLTGKIISNKINKESKKDKRYKLFYICSISNKTINYKGMLLSDLVRKYFIDLSHKDFKSNFALIHQRFSTNTFPSWDLAQPFKMICHNGEINTVRGNVNWMNARKRSMKSDKLGKDLKKIWPIIEHGQSDSACFDNALELLVMAGYSLAQAMMLLIPEAWQNAELMSEDKKAFYQYYSLFSEPWDGPSAVAFSDGDQIGATLDRNGLRPARYFITSDNRLVLSSEMGVLRVPEEQILEKFRLRPGKMLLVDLENGKIVKDEELKKEIIRKKDFKKIIKNNLINLDKIKSKDQTNALKMVKEDINFLQNTFGYTEEDKKFLIEPMIANKAEATGSMGTDTPIAVLSDKEKLLFNYFKQNFAQVTNPAIDPIREQTVMSLFSYLGSRANILNLDLDNNKRIFLKQPLLKESDIKKIQRLSSNDPTNFKCKRLDITFEKDDSIINAQVKLNKLAKEAEILVNNKGVKILILSDKKTSLKVIPFPSLLAVSFVHQHLVKKGLRTECSIIAETGEAREIHHFCLLAGYGAEAIFPYLALNTVKLLAKDLKNYSKENNEKFENNFISAVGKGILKVMSKMGISTYQSYNGAQIFDAVGLNTTFIQKYFKGTASLIEGAGFKEIITETKKRHEMAVSFKNNKIEKLQVGGEYAYRLKGEKHVWDPTSISALQHSIRSNSKEKYKEYANYVNGERAGTLNPRSLFSIKKAKKKLSLKKVEPVEEIVKRFSTGAMSFGSISREAHTTLAIAMNSLGGRSNTGEGGEERDRYKLKKNGDNLKSAIKQVASGRFGVTTEYLVNSTDIQIKIAQGAKPGEGGQLPGHKVDKVIADVRFSTPGVGLISPPPHHDIYSIEDLAQLIFDLKNVNPKARISVKLVSEIGVGTVAAGVAKSKADHITISGFEGGTGASPLTSIKHAGSPWELGLAETQQTLVLNNLRSRISLQVDGGLRTGRDVIIGALLGADEFGFSTAPLISVGCIMMRKCHLNTCPVGIATQKPELRKKFLGKPDDVIRYFFFVAEEVRNLLAEMGFSKLDDIIGRTDKLLFNKAIANWKTKGLNFSNLFYSPKRPRDVDVFNTKKQEHNIYKIMDRKFIKRFDKEFKKGQRLEFNYKINNTDRSLGAMFSGHLAKKYGHEGLKEDTIKINLTGTAGQSFGAFTSYGVTLNLEGEGNDYVGKGLSGGKIFIKPHPKSKVIPEKSIIVGNTVLYGAIAGECYFRGIAGERFAVRNSGAWAVVEGLGDHGCEYMTGGVILCLGETGKNFGAGMSGGLAYILDIEGNFRNNCNMAQIEVFGVKSDNNLNKNFINFGFLSTNMLSYHKERLYYLLTRHYNYTGSQKAFKILSNFKSFLSNFKLVLPTDYRRALSTLENKKSLKFKAKG